jgi:hypothetical protein
MFRVAALHADMDEGELLQVARMVQDGNLPERQLPLITEQDQREARFIHPDDIRGCIRDSVDGASGSIDARQPIVLVSTDAALKAVPAVRHQQRIMRKSYGNIFTAAPTFIIFSQLLPHAACAAFAGQATCELRLAN